MSTVLIGGAWVYANGSLHIGHVASLLPGDVLARYHRAKGDQVVYVSGSDCYGTPVAYRARQEGISPKQISDRYHQEFVECFDKLNFSYDYYTKTSSPEHQEFVREFHRKLYQSSYVYEKTSPQAYCHHCGNFLADRFVTGRCGICGQETRGDQCDGCGAVLDVENLIDPVCAVCNRPVDFKETKHLYIAISRMKEYLESFLAQRPHWRRNAISFTKRYLDEGLRDRALTRDLDWGITVPKEGYEDKKIYIWAENVLGYLSAGKEGARLKKIEFEKLWGPDAKHYYVHGKDNIPFHTIILPALLYAGGGWHLPDEIISSEYLTLEGRKISTSQNYAIWMKDVLDKYQSDSFRYYFCAYGPEKKDADFSWKEFITCHNSELLGAYGNFLNRTLAFIAKYLGGKVPKGQPDQEIQERCHKLYQETGRLIEKGSIRDAVREVFHFVRIGNKYFDDRRPWATRETDKESCENTIYNCVQIGANLAVALQPFLPESSEKVIKWLCLNSRWEKQQVPQGYELPETQILFARLDKKLAEEELEKLKA